MLVGGIRVDGWRERGRDKGLRWRESLYLPFIRGGYPIVQDACWDVSLMSILVRGYIVLYYIIFCILAVTEGDVVASRRLQYTKRYLVLD